MNTVIGVVAHLDDQNPWPGLAPYDEAAHAFFHGRDREAEALERLLRLAPLVALYGRSGLGKSSLLQAGLFPRLRAADMLPVYVRIDFAGGDSADPIEQIARRIEQEIATRQLEAPTRAAGESLWRWLHRKDFEIWTADNRLLTPVIVLDQFEELFSRSGGAPERTGAVFDALADLAENRITQDVAADRGHREALDTLGQRYRMLLSFREDYLPELRACERKLPSLLRHDLRLEPMALDQAEQAVALAGAAVLAPGVARAIVEFVGGLGSDARRGTPTIEPALLSLTCTQLNRRRAGRPIDAALLAAAGQDILEDFYREALADMPDSVHRFIEDHLLQGERTRGSYAVDEALAQRFVDARQLDVLTRQRRLLRIEAQGDVARIELIHDRLVDVVRTARRTRAARQAAEQDRENERRQATLQLAAAQAERAQVEQAARERAEADAARLRRGRNALLGSLAVALVMLAAAAFQTWNLTHANALASAAAEYARAEAERASEAQALAEKAADSARHRLQQATLLARYGWVADAKGGYDEAQAQQALLADTELKQLRAADTPADRLRRSHTTIEIWAKDVDEGKVRVALGELGFPIAERSAYVKALATNALWFGGATDIADVKRVALALMRAGVQLRAIRPIPPEIVAKRDLALIQVGADTSIVNRPVYTVERLLAQAVFTRE
jgi:hypothetical protein